MLRLDRICIYLLMFGIILLIPSYTMITFIDELISFSMLAIAFVDCIANGAWKKYKLLWIFMGIFTFYAIYSIYFLNYNTPRYIWTDWIIGLKPYIPFAVFLAIGPEFTEADKRHLRYISIINCSITFLILLGGYRTITPVFVNPTFAAQVAFISATFYIYCSSDKHSGTIPIRNKVIAIIMLCVGLYSLKAKYFGEFIVSIFLLTLYKPGTFRYFSIKHALILLVIGLAILGASWSKIQYYFLTGNNGGSFDPTVVESFARPVMYVTAGQILFDHFPFGTGSASFGTAASSMNYSQVYFEYNIDNVHGISWRSEESFICDAFYPSLAQYGVIGLILFIWFWFYAYNFLRIMIRTNPTLYRTQFITGAMIITFLLIESIAATTLTHCSGTIIMCILGMSCAYGKQLFKKNATVQNIQNLAIRKI